MASPLPLPFTFGTMMPRDHGAMARHHDTTAALSKERVEALVTVQIVDDPEGTQFPELLDAMRLNGEYAMN